MASKTDICNAAMTLLGQPPIQDITDVLNVNANRCNQFWEMARDAVLEDFPWHFATRRIQLALSDYTPPGEEYEYAFALPSDCLKVQNLNDEDIAYTIETDDEGNMLLLTNEDEIYLRYTWRNEMPGRWSLNFCEALAAKLAIYLCGPVIGKNNTKIEIFSKMYEDALSRARRITTDQGNEPTEASSSWLNARN